MKRRIASAAFIAAALAAAGAFAACPQNGQKSKPHTAKTRPAAGCIDLSTVPQISDHVVAAVPAGPIAKKQYSPPAATRYEGPTVGLSKLEPGVKPAPTVGYHWSLE